MRYLGLLCNVLALVAAASAHEYWWLAYFAYFGGFLYGLIDWDGNKEMGRVHFTLLLLTAELPTFARSWVSAMDEEEFICFK